MNNISALENKFCFSCQSCVQICPTSCISMTESEEGFLYPTVNEKLCLQCGLCKTHCPALNLSFPNSFETISYAAKTKNHEILMNSSSGGVFSELANLVLSENGLVYGCCLDDHLCAKHTLIDKKENLFILQKSKYVESDLTSIYSGIKNHLEKDSSPVLFTGTPCQVAGLKSFLQKSYSNLYTVDLICHGVPSRKLFSLYINWLESKFKEKIIYYDFRNKHVAGWTCGGKTKTKTKTKIINGDTDPYYYMFLHGLVYKESCYTCPFANKNRVGDITVGDFWGIDKEIPDFDYKDGTSAVLINTNKGKDLFSKIENSFSLQLTSLSKIALWNHNLNTPTCLPKIRKKIYRKIFSNPKKYFFFFKLKITVIFLLKKIIPKNLKNLIKRILYA